MKLKFCTLFIVGLLVVITGYAQQEGTSKTDTWGNVPPASDDRFTNPKSKLYAGPNGWFNFGEVRSEVSNIAKTSYAYKGGFHLVGHAFVVTETDQLHVLTLDFGADQPGVGQYMVGENANAGQKKVHLSFADVSGQKIRDWTSSDNAGTLTVSLVNGFLYVKCRNVRLQPTGLSNTGDLKQPMTLGFEGAVKPE